MSDDSNVVSLDAVRANGRKRSDFAPLVSFEGRPGECECSDFVLGVEVGLLTSRLMGRPDTLTGTFHESNSVMLERTAEAFGYSVRIEPSGTDGWVFADFERQ